MRALLDTNVIIHRENTKATSFTIGKLFYWLDKLHYEKLIHPYSIDELRKYRNPQMQSLYDAKIDAYTDMRCIAPQTAEFTALLSNFSGVFQVDGVLIHADGEGADLLAQNQGADGAHQ